MRLTPFLPAGFQMAATAPLAIVPVISAIPSPSQLSPRGVDFRDLKPPNLPSGWVGLGCYMDDPFLPTLAPVFTSDPKMTVDICVSTCHSWFTNLAGIENGQECNCGNVTIAGAKSIPPSHYNIECPGDSSQICGGSYALAIYGSGNQQQHPAAIPQNVGPWSFSGCFNDSDTARILTVPLSVIGGKYNLERKSIKETMRTAMYSTHHTSILVACSSASMNAIFDGVIEFTIKNCIHTCGAAGYQYTGMEYGVHCSCDNDINPGTNAIDPSSCMLPCPVDNLEICGGPYTIVIYNQERREGS